jgi:hypothetical protein
VKKVTMHLSPEEFVDAAEGTRPEASLPHLAECDRCRRELADLRRTMAVAVDADVPEASPLFWENLSARIGERIDAESGGSWWQAWIRPRLLVPLSAAALLVLIVALAQQSRNARVTAPVVPAPTAAVEPSNDSGDLAADPLLTLVSDLSANMDLDSVSAAGFADPDSSEHAVTHMNSDELTALKQLLQAEMTRSGA